MTRQKAFPGLTGIILGGGKSRRMGRDKRRLLVDGKPFLDKICELMHSLFEEVLVVTAEEDYDCSHLPVRLVTDRIPNKGSLGGLYTGLIEAKNSLTFVVACDMPFLNKESIALVCLESTSDAVVVELSTGIQPLHARYSKNCSSFIEQMIYEGDLKIQNLLKRSDVSVEIIQESLFEEIDPHRQSFMNINTPADLELAQKMSSHHSLS